MTHQRPTWDAYFLGIMKEVGARGTCDRGRTGCVVVRDNHILVTGYVGSPSGIKHCDEIGHELKKTVHEDGAVTTHCVRTAHAEQNAICQAAKLGVSLDGGTLYTNMMPCYTCAKMIINCGIKRLVAANDYHASEDAKRVLKESGVHLDLLNTDVVKYKDM